ncbi:thiamine pyrophosphate-binding protein [bacterium]|nr:thiamine pyrophosphate-binding protein [bacterium]
MSQPKQKVSDYIAQQLRDHHGIEHFFMVSGGGAMHLNDSLGRRLSYIAHHHEQACAFAAEGYARIHQRLAVVNVTTGPGGLNTLNGVFGQWTDSVPVLYLSGQVKTSTTLSSCPHLPLRQLGDQEVDIVSVVRPLVKYVAMVTDPQSIRYHLGRAIYEATTGRFGPVWLDIPIDVQASWVDPDTMPAFVPPPLSSDSINPEIDRILTHLKSAQRPLLVAGHGLRLSNQVDTFLSLLSTWQLPVVTTFNGMDAVPTDHPLWIGRIGTIGQRAGNFALQNADCIVFFGTRNGIRQVSYNHENFAKQATTIVIDIDEAELQKPTLIPNVPICADLGVLLPALCQVATPMVNHDWLQWCQDRKAAFAFDRTPEYQHTDDLINPYGLVHCISNALSDDAIVVMSNGSACVCTFQVANIRSTHQRWILNSGNASMGFELPACIGAALEAKGRPVVVIAGDGSIMMNLQELETIRYHQLPVTIFVIQNQGYASIKNTQRNYFDGHMVGSTPKSGVSVPDFLAVAAAFGLAHHRIDHPQNLLSEVQRVLDMKGPVVCEVVVNPEYGFSPKLSARQNPDGSMTSPSLEDMAPFLDRDELRRHMWPPLSPG